MGSTTREAITASRAALSASGGTVHLATAEQLLAAGRIIGSSSQLRAVLTAAEADPANKVAALKAVFGPTLNADVLGLLGVVVSNRWSNDKDMLAGIEELGIRAAARSADDAVDIEGELFGFAKIVRSDAELELALGSKLGSTHSKVQLVERLLAGKVSAQTLVVVRHLVQQPRGRRINALINEAASVVADQSGSDVATVTTARPLDAIQLARLQDTLSSSHGRRLKINQVSDPDLIGGVRVQIGDEIIDGSVATRLGELRIQLAG